MKPFIQMIVIVNHCGSRVMYGMLLPNSKQDNCTAQSPRNVEDLGKGAENHEEAEVPFAVFTDTGDVDPKEAAEIHKDAKCEAARLSQLRALRKQRTQMRENLDKLMQQYLDLAGVKTTNGDVRIRKNMQGLWRQIDEVLMAVESVDAMISGLTS